VDKKTVEQPYPLKDLGLWQIATADHQEETMLQAIFVLCSYVGSASPIVFLFHNKIYNQMLFEIFSHWFGNLYEVVYLPLTCLNFMGQWKCEYRHCLPASLYMTGSKQWREENLDTTPLTFWQTLRSNTSLTELSCCIEINT